MSGLLASLALIGGFIAFTVVLLILSWLGIYYLSRQEFGS
jgi:hypothetical protein